ncbi:MAG TPA: hypothetical protein VMT24_03300 [Aggregatilineaceae bacterium]|nr:hypothetical protein [Aggregatilineaceae bacterium]
MYLAKVQGSHRLEGCTLGVVSQKVSGVVVAAAIDNLRGKPGEQRLCSFSTIDHVELAFCLCADDALFEALVVSESDQDEEFQGGSDTW